MPTRLCLLVLIGFAVLIVACDRVTSPADPSALQSLTPIRRAPTDPMRRASTDPVSALAVKGRLERLVNMDDACDPETFNEAIGPGTCVRSGGVRFELFIEQLRRHGSIGSWHFAPSNMTLHEGDRFVAVNRGGEVHTFTEVDDFGGGIVPILNDAIGLTTVAPECQHLDTADFVAPGATFREAGDEGEEAGTVKYQCCIHPWMRLNATVLAK